MFDNVQKLEAGSRFSRAARERRVVKSLESPVVTVDLRTDEHVAAL